MKYSVVAVAAVVVLANAVTVWGKSETFARLEGRVILAGEGMFEPAER